MRDGVLFASPRSDGERNTVAASCVRKLGIQIPALLDAIDNPTERAYTGWPDRIYLIGRDGRVQFKTPPGPFGFSSETLEAALVRYTKP